MNFHEFWKGPCSFWATYSIHQDIRWHHQGERNTSAEEQSQNHAITHRTAPSEKMWKEGRSDPILVSQKSMTDWRSIPKKTVCFVLRIDCNQSSLGSLINFTFRSYGWGVEFRESSTFRCPWNWLERFVKLGNKKGTSLDWLKLIQVAHWTWSCFTNLHQLATRCWRFKCSGFKWRCPVNAIRYGYISLISNTESMM